MATRKSSKKASPRKSAVRKSAPKKKVARKAAPRKTGAAGFKEVNALQRAAASVKEAARRVVQRAESVMQTPPPPKLPSFDQLPVRAGAPAGAAWGVFGDDDEVGTINLLTPERVVAAAGAIRSGKMFALNLPINIPDPPLFTRGKHSHTVKRFPGADFVLDDYLDNFYPQASSQWDALCHVKHPVHGAYNGIPDGEITGRGGTRLGIDNLARHGIAGRGLLIDIARYYDKIGKRLNYMKSEAVPLEDIEGALADQKTTINPCDILLFRIGWTKFYLGASAGQKEELAKETVCPGIEGSERVARWLWNHHIAAVAADSPALENLPKGEGEDFMHFYMLAMFGMPIGEMWNLEQLADDCAADKRFTFFLTSAPLNIPGGVGSPPNALAIK